MQLLRRECDDNPSLWIHFSVIFQVGEPLYCGTYVQIKCIESNNIPNYSGIHDWESRILQDDDNYSDDNYSDE